MMQDIVLTIINSDGYYPMHNPSFGSRLTHRSSSEGQWGEYTILNAPDETRSFYPSKSWMIGVLKELDFIGWTTCNGNKAGISQVGSTVTFMMEGRRHGIPTHFHEVFKDLKPVKVLLYDSTRGDTSPFANQGLTPQKRYTEEQLNEHVKTICGRLKMYTVTTAEDFRCMSNMKRIQLMEDVSSIDRRILELI
jgi:hypothetical protein